MIDHMHADVARAVQEYMRSQRMRGHKSYVHWWYLPDSYNEWIDASVAPPTLEPDAEHMVKGPMKVYMRWVTVRSAPASQHTYVPVHLSESLFTLICSANTVRPLIVPRNGKKWGTSDITNFDLFYLISAHNSYPWGR
jgi:hypothetical protein